jgi:hypothetical protein
MRNTARGLDLPPLDYTPAPLASLIPLPDVCEKIGMDHWVATVKSAELADAIRSRGE